MKPFFSTPGRIALLQQSAEAWSGTPWRANSCVRGIGLSCQFGPAVLLAECGFPIDVAAIPKGPASWSRYQSHSLQAEWMDGHSEMFLMTETGHLLPGDIIGFKVGLCIHHLGIALPDGKFFQCCEGTGAVILSQTEHEFRKRLSRAWRPVE